ncbi:hypothetical protein ACIQOW_21445 [Kitasatospora sp. NPDC091335]|uniref:hypothetical protein n=1 Tax=Kitasatospora sp. NPDC091335 TaxID=3364085 RepID=UPI0037F79FBF
MLAGEGDLGVPGDQGVDLGAPRPGDLRGQSADRTGGTGDQQPFPGGHRERLSDAR